MTFIEYLAYFLISFAIGYLTVSALFVEDKPLGFIILNSNDE